jgi:general secretion pathway protein H
MQRQHGLTLLELLVVLAIIGVAMAGVSLSLRDNDQTQLEREAQRLVAVLEASRAQSRTSGMALIWQTTAEGFVIRPALAPNQTPSSNTMPSLATGSNANPIATRTETWLTNGTQAVISTANLVVLGPEPILAPARITLSVATNNSAKPAPTLSIGTNGLRPFQVMP